MQLAVYWAVWKPFWIVENFVGVANRLLKLHQGWQWWLRACWFWSRQVSSGGQIENFSCTNITTQVCSIKYHSDGLFQRRTLFWQSLWLDPTPSQPQFLHLPPKNKFKNRLFFKALKMWRSSFFNSWLAYRPCLVSINKSDCSRLLFY